MPVAIKFEEEVVNKHKAIWRESTQMLLKKTT